MDEASITKYITDTFEGLDIITASGDTFFFCDPDRKLPPNRRLPFATIVTSDNYDNVSNLNRPSVFRLNVGVQKETYRSMFGEPPAMPQGAGTVNTGHDYSALDQIMPHPVYASMSWVCVLNPSDATFEKVKRLLQESYEIAAGRYEKFVASQ